MKDPILKTLGFRSNRRLSADQVDIVVRHLTLFARAGGIMTWDLWRKLTPQTKAAIVEAFEKVKAEDAAAIGMATHGPLQAARVMGIADGGELETRMVLDQFIDNVDLAGAPKHWKMS